MQKVYTNDGGFRRYIFVNGFSWLSEEPVCLNPVRKKPAALKGKQAKSSPWKIKYSQVFHEATASYAAAMKKAGKPYKKQDMVKFRTKKIAAAKAAFTRGS